MKDSNAVSRHDELSHVPKLLPHQEKVVARLFPLVCGSNPFYSKRLRSASSLEPANYFDLPFTYKAELITDQEQNPPFGSNLTFVRSSYTRLSHTSGTSTTPLYWLDTEASWDWMVTNWMRVYEAARVTGKDSVFFAFSFGPFLGFWTAFEAATKLGALAIPGGGLTSLARLQKLIDLEATVLCCTPTYALRLGVTAQDHGVDLAQAKITRIIVAGECGGSLSSTRLRIQSLWNGAQVLDHYGMTEVGPAGYSCPSCTDLLHIMSSCYITEIVDPGSGLPAEPGILGELVLTPLGRSASPVLRYRTGDLVKSSVPRPCACGSTDIGFEGGILGRADDMLIVRGVNVFPSSIERMLLAYGVLNYRVDAFEQRGMPELYIQVEGPEDQLRGRLDDHLSASLGLRVQLSYVRPGYLPDSDGKRKQWTRHY
jgi:phenylacetate-CoA ligase